MAVRRGVSLYSYQQEQFFKKMDWKAQVREVREHLHTDGIEIINEQLIRHYPFPSEEFLFDWRSYLARYDMNPVTMDVYMDVHQFRDHVMTHHEAAEHLKNDIILASRMGFKNLRVLVLVPIDVIEEALPTAEKYGVKLGKEIHAPLPVIPSKRIQPQKGMAAALDWQSAQQIMDLRDRTGSPYVGLVPDFGIFQFRAPQISIDYMKRHSDNPDMIDFIFERRFDYTQDEFFRILPEKFPGAHISLTDLERISMTRGSADPEDIAQIIPYIISIHGKFYDMTEIDGCPGCYEDKSINYETPVRILCENGFEGYINSEYEGQRDQQDMGEDDLPDSAEQVRRHHEMLRRLISKYSR